MPAMILLIEPVLGFRGCDLAPETKCVWQPCVNQTATAQKLTCTNSVASVTLNMWASNSKVLDSEQHYSVSNQWPLRQRSQQQQRIFIFDAIGKIVLKHDLYYFILLWAGRQKVIKYSSNWILKKQVFVIMEDFTNLDWSYVAHVLWTRCGTVYKSFRTAYVWKIHGILHRPSSSFMVETNEKAQSLKSQVNLSTYLIILNDAQTHSIQKKNVDHKHTFWNHVNAKLPY